MYPFEGEAPMFESLEIFDLAAARARHAATRQSVIARNIANADTPGYRAQDITPFEDIFDRTAPGRLSSAEFGRTHDAHSPNSPNGNSVSLELEMMRGVETQRDHDRALMVYRTAMSVLRMSLGR
ncbi:FlgB family protein [Rhodobacterales bacterium HKCCE2091]|nr:FlgB family protein [Rhodobacterales bacterium HKCCE2091]